MNVDKPVELRSEDKKGADIIAGQHENKGHKDIKSTGKSEAQEKDLDYGKSCDSTSKKVDLCGMKVPESYLETKDWNCVLHINTKRTFLISPNKAKFPFVGARISLFILRAFLPKLVI